MSACSVCSKELPAHTLRPYGKDGKDICFSCAMADKDATDARFEAIIDGILERDGFAFLTDKGPASFAELQARRGRNERIEIHDVLSLDDDQEEGEEMGR